MAKISDDIIKLNININGDEAQNEITKISQRTADLKEKIEGLTAEENLLKKSRKDNKERLAELSLEIKKHEEAIESNNAEIYQLVKSMNIMDLTMSQLRARSKALRYELANMNPNSDAFKAGQQEMHKLNDRMAELRKGGQSSKKTLMDLSETIDRYTGLATVVIAGVAGVGLAINNIITANNKLADAQTAVAKTTGLSNDEVKELTKSFSEFDTRTKKIDLLKISEIGGRLGVPKNEIKEFTREVDKAYVALGDSFTGGVEEVAEKIGKIKGLFKETKDLDMATAINQIGSSLNELGANGAASEGNVAEFALRVGALPEKLKPTVAEAMALGAAFEESGIDAERASTAYSSFVRTAAKESGKFAEVMGITKQEVEDLLNKNPNEFFLKFAEGAKGLDAIEMANMLDYLKLNDQYVVSILGSASENTDKFRNSIELSNQALKEATSLQQEFDKVNNNAAAIYEKVSKAFSGIFTNEAVAKTLNWLVEVIGRLLGVTMDTGERMSFFTGVVVTLARVIVALGVGFGSVGLVMGVYNTLLKESLLRTLALESIEKTRLVTSKLMLSFQSLWNSVVASGQRLLASYGGTLISATQATNLQAAAQARSNAIMAASPWGAIATLVGLAISAYMTYSMMVDDVVEKQKSLADITKEAADSASAEISQLDRLYKAATDVSKGKDAQREAVEKLQKQYPSYFGNMSQEEIMVGKLKGKYLELRHAIIEAAKARAIEKELERIAGERIKHKEEADKKLQSNFQYRQHTRKYGNEGGDAGVGVLVKSSDDYIKDSYDSDKKIRADYNKKEAELKSRENYYLNQITANQHKYVNLEKDRAAQGVAGGGSNYKTNFGEGGKSSESKGSGDNKESEATKKLREAKEKVLEELGKWNDKINEQELKSREYRIELMEDGLAKELAIIETEADKKIEALEKQKYSQEQFADLDKMIAGEKEGSQEREDLEKAKANWKKYNDELVEFQKQEIEIASLKMQVASQKAKNKEWEEKQKSSEKQLQDLELRQKQELAGLDSLAKQKEFLQDKISKEELDKINTWEEGKQKVLEIHQMEQLELQRSYLRSLIEEMEAIPSFQLSPEQIKQLEELREKLADVGVTMAEIKGKKEDGEKDSETNFSSLSSFGGGSSDIFGLSQEQWEAMFTNTDKLEVNIQKVGAAIKVAQNLMSNYYSFVKANQEAELRRYEIAHSRKQKTLEAQLAAGIISQQEYKHATIANENELAMKRYQLELDAAKREKAMKIADTISNTAMAIMSIWSKEGRNPIIAGILTGLVTAMGAVQVATIAAQPLPQPPAVQGAEDGYYPVIRKQDGKLFNARKRESRSGIYDEPTMLVGEQGKNFPELVVSGRAMKRIDPKIQNEFMSEVARVEGFENGLYPTTKTSSGNDEMMIRLMEIIQRNTETMERLEQNGVRGVFEKSARVGKDLEDMQKEYKRLIDKNRH